MQLETMKAELSTALSASEAIISAAEKRKGPLTSTEQSQLTTHRKPLTRSLRRLRRREKRGKILPRFAASYRRTGLGS